MIVTKETQNERVDLSAIPAVVPNLIGGADALAADGRTFAKLDPATGREICRVARSAAADVELAVDSGQASAAGMGGDDGGEARRHPAADRAADARAART